MAWLMHSRPRSVRWYEDRRQHRGFPQVHGVGGEHARVHQPGVAADACQGFLDAFEGRQRHVELLANLGVLAGHQAGELGGAGADAGREIERPTDRQFISIIQPLPSISWPPIRSPAG
jgi:hypothetical protein